MVTKDEIISYVMNTPANTNEAVLRSLLDGLGGGGEVYNGEVEYPTDVK